MPAAFSREEVEAMKRYLAGERLGQAARRTLRRAEKKARRHDSYIHSGAADEDWKLREQFYQEQQERARSPARPGAASSLAATPRAAAGAGAGPVAGGGLALGRRSSFDGRSCSPQELRARLSQLHLDSSWYQVDQATEDARRTRQSPAIGLLVKEQRAQLDAAKRQTDRAAALEASKIDGRSAPAEAVQTRLQQLHIDREIQRAVREHGKPLAAKEEFNPMAATLEARRRAERRAREAVREKRPVDARSMPGDVLTAYMRLRGWTPPAG